MATYRNHLRLSGYRLRGFDFHGNLAGVFAYLSTDTSKVPPPSHTQQFLIFLLFKP